MPKAPDLKVVSSPNPKEKKKRKKKKKGGMHARWSKRLAEGQFVPVSSYFLKNYHRLTPHKGAVGLNSSEALLLIHILDYKWTQAAPFPSMKSLASRMGLSVRHVRDTVRKLEELKLLERRRPTQSSQNRFHFDGLYRALEELMDADKAAAEAAEDDDDQEGE